MLPAGGLLPDAIWWRRHRGITAVLWVHVALVPAFGLVRGVRVVHVVAETGLLLAAATVASIGGRSRTSGPSRRIRTAATSVGLLSASAIVVHFSGGVIEAHFHFFVMVALVALYQDWLPFLAAVAYVFIHHGAVGVIDPNSVFNHAAARESPWEWAGVHALFITGISVVCLIGWQLNERAMADHLEAEEELRAEKRITDTLYDVGQVLAAELDTQRVVQTVTDAATDLSGAAFGAFFHNVIDDSGAKYMLYSLSGAPREAFSEFGLPRATALFGPTFAGDGVIRLDDVAQDARFGRSAPHHGMPAGHLPVVSYLAVPVKTRAGEVLGGLFFGHPEPARFTAVAERIVVGIAAQAAIALDNARLYARQRSVAETLQQSLLPERLPEIAGIALAARYSAGGPDVEVGGDWYDVLVLPNGHIVIAMGDVVGRGKRAAALMGQLRAGLRAYAADGKTPADALAGLNSLLLDNGPEHMATLVFGILDPDRFELRLANAGHPPPILSRDGTTTRLEAAGGVPLGAVPGAAYAETCVRVEPGTTVFFYTDGLVEVPGESLEAGLDRLVAAVAGASGDVEALCDRVTAATARAERNDDAAMLALRVEPLGDSVSLQLPADPHSLRDARATLRRWLAEQGADAVEAYELLVVGGELCGNAVRHAGGGGRGFSLDASVDGTGVVTLRVHDEGSWRQPQTGHGGGRGLAMVDAFSDELTIDRGAHGTTVTAKRRLMRSQPVEVLR